MEDVAHMVHWTHGLELSKHHHQLDQDNQGIPKVIRFSQKYIKPDPVPPMFVTGSAAIDLSLPEECNMLGDTVSEKNNSAELERKKKQFLKF